MTAPWFVVQPWVKYFNFKLVECYHIARFEKATRYYIIRLEQDLLGDWTLCVTNGRIKSKLGQSRIIAFQRFSDAYEHFCLMAKERNQRSYHPVSYYTEDVLYQVMLLCTFDMEKPAQTQKRKAKRSSRPAPAIKPQLYDAQQIPFYF